jgi:septal ring factor EnvC (AmiA/AmiB activator)
MRKNSKDLQAKLDKAEEVIEQYRAALIAKGQEVRALQQKLSEVEAREKMRYDGNSNDGG